MSTAQFQSPNYTGDDAATYKSKIDASFKAIERTAAAFQCYADNPAGMTVKVAAGAMQVANTMVEKAIQTTGTITAPSANPRIDRVVMDSTTGVISVLTGAESPTPVAPSIPAGYLPCARFQLATSTTAIINTMIVDERVSLQRAAAPSNFFANQFYPTF